jgi:mannose-1-phosphate guanylyltransferase/phosphomannomutase
MRFAMLLRHPGMISKTVLILCGGRGSRSANPGLAKSLQLIGSETLLRKQIEELDPNANHQIIFIAGWDSNSLIKEIDEVMVSYPECIWSVVVEDNPSGTNNAVIGVLDQILSENVMILLGDLYIEGDVNRYFDIWAHYQSDVLLVGHPNDHPDDSDLVLYDTFSLNVIKHLSKKRRNHPSEGNMALAGITLLRKKCIPRLDASISDVIDAIFAMRNDDLRIDVFPTIDCIKDTGTADRLAEVRRMQSKNRYRSRCAVFLDFDGTLVDNQEVKVSFSPELLDIRVIEALKNITKRDIPIFIVTNQPGIAKGLFTKDDFNKYRESVESHLSKHEVKIYRWFVCPHHPDSGFPGEISDLKQICDCRKPSTAFATEAEKFYGVDLSRSYMFGDSEVDKQFALNSGIKFEKVTLLSDTIQVDSEFTWDALSRVGAHL